MTKDEYLRGLIQMLALIQNRHSFEEGPLSQRSLVHLAAFKNAGVKMGFPTISGYLDRVIKARNDGMAQQIYLFHGLSKNSGLVQKDTKPLSAVVSDRYRGMGGDPDGVRAEVMDQVSVDKDKIEDTLATSMETEEELDMGDLETDNTAQSLGDLGLSTDDEAVSSEEEEVVEPEEEPEDDKARRKGDEEDDLGSEEDRVAQEGDEEEFDDEHMIEPEPLHDGRLFEWADLELSELNELKDGDGEVTLAYTPQEFILYTSASGRYMYIDYYEKRPRPLRKVQALAVFRRAAQKLVDESEAFPREEDTSHWDAIKSTIRGK